MTPDPHIEFPCQCGHTFAIPADQAGMPVRCPECGVLVNAPEADEVGVLGDDGALLLKDEPAAAAATSRKRPKPAPVAAIPVLPIEVVGGEPVPVEPADIPIAARALSYAEGDRGRRISLGQILAALCHPTNLLVMAFVLGMHVIAQVVAMTIAAGFFLVAPFTIIVAMLIFAHYANTIDDIAREGADELPAAIRGLSLSEDLWQPFKRVAASILLCYGPSYVVAVHLDLPTAFAMMLAGALFLAGTFFYPAVLLTVCTAGALNNLRPDRVMGVIRAAGREYARTVGAWAATLAAYALWALASTSMFVRIMSMGSRGGIGGATVAAVIGHPAVVFAALFLAIYAAHAFCWHLSLIYRGWHDEFPWVLQYHVSTRRQADRAQAALARRRKRRYVSAAPRDATPVGNARSADGEA